MTSIIIPSYNSQVTIGRCLEAVFKDRRSDSEVIVVDDGSTDDTEGIVGGFPISFFKREHKGQASALNFGAAQARGEILIFLDSDCAPLAGWFENLLKPFNDPVIGATLGMAVFADKEDAKASWWTHWLYEYALRGLTYTDHASTYSLAVRRALFGQAGGFREEIYKAPCQFDVEFGFYLVERGYKILLVRDALVYHYHTVSFLKTFKKQKAQARWLIPLILRNKRLHDDYSRIEAYLKVILPLLFIISIPFIFVNIYPFIIFIIFSLFVYAKTAFWVVSKTKKLNDFSIIFFQFYISLAWLTGIIEGLYLEIIRKKKRS